VLQDKVTPKADTLQKLLIDPKLQDEVKSKVIIVDEAGFISSKQMRNLSLLAERNDNRVILVGEVSEFSCLHREFQSTARDWTSSFWR
jgi:thymidine kinase